MIMLSPHFSLREWTRSQRAARDGLDNTPSADAIKAGEHLMLTCMEPIRLHFGRVDLSSGYRAPAVNEAEGGSPDSQHVATMAHGAANDFEVPGVDNMTLAKWISGSGLIWDQLILEFHDDAKPDSGWVHLSVGPRNRRQVLRARLVGKKKVYTPGLT